MEDASMVKTVIGSFDSYNEAREVVRDLKDEGFMESDISIVASNVGGAGQDEGGTTLDADNRTAGEASIGDRRMSTSSGSSSTTSSTGSDTGRTTTDTGGAATGAVAGGVLGGAAGVAASLMGLAIPGIGPIIAAGPILAGLTGAGVGAVAGGLIGGLTNLGVSEEHAAYYAESVRRGGALVTIRVDEGRAERAAKIMQDHGAVDIESRVDRWRESGWNGYDQGAQPYTSDQVERERSMYQTSTRSSQPRSSSEASDWGSMENDFRSDFDTRYAGQGSTFDDYAPAYRHGWESARNSSYRGRNWDDVEPSLRSDWERNNPGRAWDRFKDAVRRGWDRLTGDDTSMSGTTGTTSRTTSGTSDQTRLP